MYVCKKKKSLVTSTLEDFWSVYLLWSLILSCHLAVVFPCVGEVTKTKRNPHSYQMIYNIYLNHHVHSQNKQDIAYTEICLKIFAISDL